MPLYAAVTGGQLIRDLARMLGDIVWDATAGSATGTTIVASNTLAIGATNSLVIGAWIYTTGGTGANQERAIGANSISAGDVTFTLSTNGPSWTTTPDSTTTFIITRIRPTHLLRALQEAQRYQTQRLLSLLPVTGREIVIGSILPNNFDLFTTANVPDGLTLGTGTFTNEATVTAGGRRGLRLVTDGTNAGSVRFAAPRWGKWRGQTARLRVLLRASIASRVTIEINDGTGTATTDTAETNNRWEYLTAERAINEAATQVRFSVEVSSGAAVTVDMSYWYGEDPAAASHEYPIDVDRNLVGISDLWVGGLIGDATSQESYNFNQAFLPPEAYDIFEDVDNTPRLLRLRIGSEWNQRVLEYKGWQRQAELTGPTITWNGTPELILARAKYYMLRETASGEDDFARLREFRRELEEIERPEPKGLAVRLPHSLKRVQAQ